MIETDVCNIGRFTIIEDVPMICIYEELVHWRPIENKIWINKLTNYFRLNNIPDKKILTYAELLELLD